jgi:glycosyltransferase involved in cell wall biosynthesis
MTSIKKEKIFFDARYIDPVRMDGIGRYSLELLRAFSKLHPNLTMMIFSRSQLARLPKGLKYEIFPPINSFREIFSARRLNELDADVVYSPLFNFAQTIGSKKWFFGMFGKRRFKLILTLHDTFYFQFRTPPSWLDPFSKIVWRLFYLTPWPMRLALNRADAVVTVSETSREEILKLILTRRPMTVIYNASTNLLRTVKKKSDAVKDNEKPLLYMGSFFGYKNVETLIASLQFLPPEYRLVCCSRITSTRKKELLAGAAPEVRERIDFLNGVSDDEYAKLLHECFALVSASRSEGFNLQLVEAMAAGAPVVGSGLPVHREVAGDAALFFDLSEKISGQTVSDDARKMAEQVRTLEDRAFRDAKIGLGLRRAEVFSWEKSAKKLDGLIAKIAK